MKSLPREIQVDTIWTGREEVHLHLHVSDQNQIEKAELWGIGGPELLKLLKEYRGRLQGDIQSLPLPPGTSSAHLCIRETFLKAKGEWSFPYGEDELCHCRAVLTSVVDQAICAGAHTPQKVTELTSASTACGTCRPHVQAIIDYRLKNTSS